MVGIAGRRGRCGFTLIELMVVAAIIVVLMGVTLPAIRSLIESSQQAQAENIVRANLMAVRSYAMSQGIMAGLRIQDDGRLVQVYAANYHTVFSTADFRSRPTYQMRAIEERSPDLMPGPWRVISDGYSSFERASNNWWTGERWFATVGIMFSHRGRGIQARCVFPRESWFPSSQGDYGRWTYDLASQSGTVYDFQGGTGIHGWNPNDLVLVPTTGPNVTTEFRIYDSSTVRGMLRSASVSPNNYPAGSFNLDTAITNAKRIIDLSAVDFLIDVNTGMMIRRRAAIETDVN